MWVVGEIFVFLFLDVYFRVVGFFSKWVGVVIEDFVDGFVGSG